MAQFNMRAWFVSKGKKAVTPVKVPIQGEEKPAKFRLVGLCDPSLAALQALAAQQKELIPGSLPNAEIDGGVIVSGKALFEPNDFTEMLKAVKTGQIEEVKELLSEAETKAKEEEAKKAAEEKAKQEAEAKAKEEEEAKKKAEEEAKKLVNGRNNQPAQAPRGGKN